MSGINSNELNRRFKKLEKIHEDTNIWNGLNHFTHTSQSLIKILYSDDIVCSMTDSMFYYIDTTTTNRLTSLKFIDVPQTSSTFKFTFILKPSSANQPYFLKPPRQIGFTYLGGYYILYSEVFGESNIIFPSSYTYILQTFTFFAIDLGNPFPLYTVFMDLSFY